MYSGPCSLIVVVFVVETGNSGIQPKPILTLEGCNSPGSRKTSTCLDPGISSFREFLPRESGAGLSVASVNSIRCLRDSAQDLRASPGETQSLRSASQHISEKDTGGPARKHDRRLLLPQRRSGSPQTLSQKGRPTAPS